MSQNPSPEFDAEAIDFDSDVGGIARAYQTTQAQREIWLADRLSKEASLAYNESITLRLQGALRLDALRGALQDLIARHEALRSTISPDGEYVSVLEQVTLDIPVIPGGPDPAKTLAQACLRAVDTPFDLETGPLLRAEIVSAAETDHAVVLTAHHIVCDGWSFGVLVKDLAQLYDARRQGQQPTLEPAHSFGDYSALEAATEGSAETEADLAYWLTRFSNPAPILELPTDRPRRAWRTFASGRIDHTLDVELVSAIRKVGAQSGASLVATLLGSFAALLRRLTSANDVVIGIAAAGQSSSGQHELVGHCVNLLPLRFDVDAQAPFKKLVADSRGTVLDAFEHYRVTLGTLLQKLNVQRDTSRLMLTSVLFNVDQEIDRDSSAFGGLTFDVTANPRTYENFELFINAVQTRGALRIECQYNSDLFDEVTVRRWLGCYETLLRGAVRDPNQPVAQLPLLSSEEFASLQELNARTVADYPRRSLVHDLVHAQAARTPTATAIRFQNTELKYGDLSERAHRLAHVLRARGIGEGARVGLCLERGPDLVVALLAVLEAGGAYIPLDPAYPPQRLAYCAQDAGIGLLITQGSLSELLAVAEDRKLLIDRIDEEWRRQPATALAADSNSAQVGSAAYIIYTSGSTGNPKGVAVPHSAVVNFITSMLREPGIAAHDRLLAVTTLAFDIAVLELIATLAGGAQVLLASREDTVNGDALRELLENHKATMMQATPATWRLLIEAGWQGGPHFKALCGGEALPLDLARLLLARTGQLWNMYGPTETTVWSTCWRVENPEAGISIGRPIANTTVWVLDELRQPLPVGVPGELYIGGDGVALGYLNRDELTSERFLPDPFSTSPIGRIYRTGDRARWRNDGRLEHMGRTDFQVKVRGFRIELGEIESNLVLHPDVARALTIVREDRPGDVRLVAYVVPTDGRTVDAASLRRHLKLTLPEYMLPQHFVPMKSLPVLPNGKIDRNALPQPESGMSAVTATHVPPRNDLERQIAASMEAVLGLPGVGVTDSFFALGGHSLLAAQLTSRLNREFGVRLSLRTVFEAPTVAGLCSLIEKTRGSQSNTAPAPQIRIQPLAQQSPAPASMMQQRLWFLEELNPGRVVYNTPSAHRLRGPMNEAAFELALNEVVRRQPSLRTSLRRISDERGTRIVQVLHDVKVSLFPAVDLSAVPAAQREQELLARLDELTNTPFDLTAAPLFRAVMFRLGPQEHVLFFMPHHAIWDGWSFDILYSEMTELYGAYAVGRTPSLPALPISYGDYAAWHLEWAKSSEFDVQVQYWRKRLAESGEVAALPTDKPRRPGMSGEGVTEWIAIDKAKTEALREYSRKFDTTLFMTLLSVYYLLLYRSTGQRHLVIGTPVRNRNVPEVEPIMGYFTNLLPLHLQIEPSESFTSFVARVKSVVLDSFTYPEVPLEQLSQELTVQRDNGGSILYQALFSFQDARQRAARWGELTHDQVLVFQRGATEDLGLWFLDNDKGMVGGITYNADIISPETAKLLRERYLHLLDAVLASPAEPVGEIRMLRDSDISQIQEWNRRVPLVAPAASLHALFEAAADANPKNPAVIAGGWSVSYGEIEQQANRIAHCLAKRGARSGTAVALCAEPGQSFLSALLGILKAGGSCLVLDPGLSQQQVGEAVKAVGARVFVGNSRSSNLIEGLALDSLFLDLAGSEIAASPATRPATAPAQTSATAALYVPLNGTGAPLSVVTISHAAVTRALQGLARDLNLTSEDRSFAPTNLIAESAAVSWLLPWVTGATSVVPGPGCDTDAAALRKDIETNGVTLLALPVETFQRLLETGWQSDPRLTSIVTADRMPVEIGTAVKDLAGTFLRAQGWAEVGFWTSLQSLQEAANVGAVGKPGGENVVWVLDEAGRTAPVGVYGTVWVTGPALAEGYAGSAQATSGRFSNIHPEGSGPAPMRAFRAARGRWRADGLLDVVTDESSEIMIGGVRLDLTQLTSAVRAQPGADEAIVVVRELTRNGRHVIAYVGGTDSTQDQAIRAVLAGRVPAAIATCELVRLPALPKTPFGRIDLRNLPLPVQAGDGAARQDAFVTPATETERKLAAVWQELLGLPRVSTRDNFFDLGGHSLMAMQVIAQMEKLTGKQIPPRLFLFETLARIADAYDKAVAEAPKKAGLFKRLFAGRG